MTSHLHASMTASEEDTMEPTATQAATDAAAGYDKKTKRPALETPVSASYPSELRSPMPGTSGFTRKDDNIKTPITPPSAYMDFLKGIPTALISPPRTGESAKFPNSDAPRAVTTASPDNMAETLDNRSNDMPHPSLSRHTSIDSSSSYSTISSVSSESSASSTIRRTSITTPGLAGTRSKPQSPRLIIPPSPFARPPSARTPRHAHMPPSPFSSASVRSPISARSMQIPSQTMPSPYSASGLSGTPWSTTYSPRTNFTPRMPASANEMEVDGRSRNSRISVRQIVTRTVTYCKTPLDPAPKGKRRKVEGAFPTTMSSSEEDREETKAGAEVDSEMMVKCEGKPED